MDKLTVEKLVEHMNDGKVICGGMQHIYKVGDLYYLGCVNIGCCDSYMTESEVLQYIDDDWYLSD